MARHKQNINLIYIRAAIEAKTGHRLSLSKVRQLLLEENLITPRQARNNSREFEGYSEFYTSDINDRYIFGDHPELNMPDDVQGLLNENFKIGEPSE